MADYSPERWLARQLAWENALDRLREKAGVEVAKDPGSARRPRKTKRAGRDLPTPTKAA